MFRSFLLSLGVFLLIGGAFVVYLLSQPRVVVTTPSRPMTLPATAPTDLTQMQIGPGNRAWVNSYDQQGRLVSQFNAEEYKPQGQNTFAVVKPVCRFYLAGGQLVTLKGESGTVFVDGGRSSSKGFAVATVQSPSRGQLKTVHIALYRSPDAARPTQWMDTDNIAFDNDTLRMFTEPYIDSTGQTVAADQVPVAIRGDEYEFDGKGLILRWNDRDARVQLLEIAHGDRLLIKDTKALMAAWANPAPATRPGPTPAKSLVVNNGKPPDAVKPALPAGPTLYLAEFADAVRVLQDGRLTAAGDDLRAEFISGHAPGATTSGRAPNVTASASTVPTVSTVSTRPAVTRPTSAPAVSWVLVRWTGKLRVTPESAPSLPLPATAAGTVVQLRGNPATLTPPHAALVAPLITYRTGDGATLVEPSAGQNVVRFGDDHGVSFTGQKIAYDPATSIGTLTGPAELVQPVEGQPGHPLTARWTGPGLLHVVPHGQQLDFVDHVDLHDAVVVNHPQFHLVSDELTLALSRGPKASATTAPVTRLDQAVAIGNAQCEVHRPGEPAWQIHADRLALVLQPDADGKSAPHEVLADGHVLAFDPQQKISAGHLDAVLAPAPADTTTDESAVAVQTVHATDAVRVQLHSGAIADADELWLTTPNGHNQIDLHSASAARVTDGKGGALSGVHIRLLPDDSIIRVLGPGALDTASPAEHGNPPKRVHATWQARMDIDENANTADAYGSVEARSARPDGTLDTLTADHVHANLMDTPAAARPSTRPVSTSLSAPAKTLKDMAITGNVIVRSELFDAVQTLLKQQRLLCDTLLYDAATGIATIPGPGKLFSQDQRPPTTAPVAANGPGETRGVIAVAWQKDAVYRPADHQIVLRGDTLVAYKKTPQQAIPMRLASQVLTLTLSDGATKTKIAKGMQLSHVTASRAVRFTSADADFVAHQIDYDPATGIMTATASDAEPAEVLRGNATGRFTRLDYDVKQEVVKQVDGLNARTP